MVEQAPDVDNIDQVVYDIIRQTHDHHPNHDVKHRTANALELYEDSDDDTASELVLSALNDLIKEGLVTQDQIFSWLPKLERDLYLIDEGQDWTEAEIALIYWLARKSSRVTIALGPDQILRGQEIADWKQNPLMTTKVRVRERHYDQNLRMSKMVHQFNEQFRTFFTPDQEETILDEDNSIEGFVCLLPDSVVDENWFKKMEKWTRKNECDPVGALIFDPLSLPEDRRTIQLLQTAGLHNWNGISRNVRKHSFPTDDQFRVVTYESARGLEAYLVVARCCDRALEHLTNISKNADEGHRRLKIAFTRAACGLVITYQDKNSALIRQLQKFLEFLKTSNVSPW
jgi:superfamily I DNA/RNA helicase